MTGQELMLLHLGTEVKRMQHQILANIKKYLLHFNADKDKIHNRREKTLRCLVHRWLGIHVHSHSKFSYLLRSTDLGYGYNCKLYYEAIKIP